MVHISAKLAVVALAAAPALATAVAYDALEYDARDYDDMTDIEARKIPIGGLKVAAKFAGKWFNRLSTGATVLSLGGAAVGAASQPRSFDDFEDLAVRLFEEESELEARGKNGKTGKKGRKGKKGGKGKKGKKGGKRGRKAKKAKAAAATEATPDAASPEAAVPDDAAAQAPVEGRMVKRRLSARDFMLDEELEAFEAREEFFNNLYLD